MVSEYTVIDQERQSLILLRPHQIYAIEAVMHRIHDHQDGFVWHTTGSGKTLTSYKTAKLAAQDPGVDKVIFLVDRRDLDEQTASNFSAYAANDDIAINEAQNTGDLMRKLQQNDGKVLVTSIQKLHQPYSAGGLAYHDVLGRAEFLSRGPGLLTYLCQLLLHVRR